MYYFNKYRIACKYSALISATITLILVYLSKNKPTNELYIIRWNLTEDISCHANEEGDALASVDDTFRPPEKSIFFVETSCRGGLTSRQACAVESAAKSNPHWDVHVLFSGSVSDPVLRRSCLSKLVDYKNVKLLRIHIADYARGTPLENMVAASPYKKSKWRIEHSSDVLRYLTLFKYGGVYMDSDVVVVKSLDSLGSNFAGRESEKWVAAGVLSFSRDDLGRQIANATIEDFRKNYRPKVWGNNGPGVITRVLKQMCKAKGKEWNRGCNGFTVYEPEVFYPVFYKQNKMYFKAGAKIPNRRKTYVHHLWNALTRKYKVQKNSPYDILAKEHCPSIYTLYGDHFGT
ncbi:unnamed protein product [Chilo suppressalis]|uniref:Alpha 1,4-glycosyltransferase domain-containing protein n=1 Tax=Chilo suppressalis TaxID=168631 RepID=A0ABN8L4I4_CHISP|nr:unnamed protein product [Chilo suppressalis]